MAELPYGHLNLYANAEFTLSDRVHACVAGHGFAEIRKETQLEWLDKVLLAEETSSCERTVSI